MPIALSTAKVDFKDRKHTDDTIMLHHAALSNYLEGFRIQSALASRKMANAEINSVFCCRVKICAAVHGCWSHHHIGFSFIVHHIFF